MATVGRKWKFNFWVQNKVPIKIRDLMNAQSLENGVVNDTFSFPIRVVGVGIDSHLCEAGKGRIREKGWIYILAGLTPPCLVVCCQSNDYG
jgi:hypothetical protein